MNSEVDELVCRRLVIRHPNGRSSLTLEATETAAGIWGESFGHQFFAINIDQEQQLASIELWNLENKNFPRVAIGVGPHTEPTLQIAIGDKTESIPLSRLLEAALPQEMLA